MLTLVEVINSRSNTLSLPIADSSSGYVVKSIEGLDPVKAALTTSTLAGTDGAQAQNARRDTRNILIKLGLQPDYISTTVQSLRSALYDWFLPKSNVGFKFYLDGVLHVTTSGQVETCGNSMFSQDPEVDISVICYDPDFYAPASEILTENTVTDTSTVTVAYGGSSDAGVIFTLNIDRDLTGFTIYNTTPENVVQKTDIVGTFVADDIVVINSVPGSKAITLLRGSVSSSILYYLDPSSDWVTLKKGSNEFRVYASGASMIYTLEYTPLYGAI